MHLSVGPPIRFILVSALDDGVGGEWGQNPNVTDKDASVAVATFTHGNKSIHPLIAPPWRAGAGGAGTPRVNI